MMLAERHPVGAGAAVGNAGYLRCGTTTSVMAVVAAPDRSSAATEDTHHGPVPRAVGTPLRIQLVRDGLQRHAS